MELNNYFGIGNKPSIEETFGIIGFIITIVITMNYSLSMISSFSIFGIVGSIKKFIEKNDKKKFNI